MLSRKKFIQISLEVNLFYQRIMKEHMFLIETSLHPAGAKYMAEADLLKLSFEGLLSETVKLSDGAITNLVIKSNEIVTKYTLQTEEITSKLTGASLDTNITTNELKLTSDPDFEYTESLETRVSNLNTRAANLLGELISFKEALLADVLVCKVAIGIYPDMLSHLIREAKLYQKILACLHNKELLDSTLCEELNFWNHIMEDHAEFIDGMLDPTEVDLKETAEGYAILFEKLVQECIKSHSKAIVNASLQAAEGIRDFKIASVEGLLECDIKSIIPPLLADHVLREANHYIRLLEMIK